MLDFIRFVIVFLFLLLVPALSLADECWSTVQPGQHSQELRCQTLDWRAHPDAEHLKQILDTLFYVYLSDANQPEMKAFFDGMRASDPRYAQAFQMRADLIRKYTFDVPSPGESSALWAMPAFDAKRLFVLSLTEPGALPADIASAMHLAVYDELDRYFDLKSAFRHGDASLRAADYARLLEILQRMAAFRDPFLYAVNQTYQALAHRSLNQPEQAGVNLEASHRVLDSLLLTAKDPLSRKRILRTLALTNLVQGKELEAEQCFYSILRIDPEDWNSILDLSYVLNQRGECSEPAVWIEASLKHDQQLFDVVVHCGSRGIPEEEYPTEPPAIASLLAGVVSR